MCILSLQLILLQILLQEKKSTKLQNNFTGCPSSALQRGTEDRGVLANCWFAMRWTVWDDIIAHPSPSLYVPSQPQRFVILFIWPVRHYQPHRGQSEPPNQVDSSSILWTEQKVPNGTLSMSFNAFGRAPLSSKKIWVPKKRSPL